MDLGAAGRGVRPADRTEQRAGPADRPPAFPRSWWVLVREVAMRRAMLAVVGTAAGAGLLIAAKLGVAGPTDPNAALADAGATAAAGGGPTGGTVADATAPAARGTAGGAAAGRTAAPAPAASTASRKAPASTKAAAGGGGGGGGGGATTGGGAGGGGGGAAGTGLKDGTFTGAAAAA